MFKIIYCLRRLPHLTHEEFYQYWREIHGPLVKKHAEVLRIRRYIQQPSIENVKIQEKIRATRNTEIADYDGVAELWWDSLEDHAEPRRSQEGVAAADALLEDEKRFIDLSRSRIWYATEREIIS
ncbi:ethyl tert-butyl ether degradation protein EthD [Alkalihalophilus pseudofirmus]|nr:ethyl tert-butyl ether degradation protein EthD [Alkalihalophilus pseudofirmus]